MTEEQEKLEPVTPITKHPPVEEGIINAEVSEEMRKAYLDYAMSVIVSRAIPSIEDGMKPVQRRILYAMHQMGLKPTGQTKKSARVVGEVMGKYHPHGDSSIYEAMVRMAQTFSLRYPLVYGQGNFGSIDGDSPAAMRYTEAKLQKLSFELLEDIEKETVQFVPNYDGSVEEPSLLPGKLPALMLNGATGIAVGMATNIPPHNLTEVCDALIAHIQNPEITIDELCKIITGPDFPTGGLVQGNMSELYKTGKGKLIMRGRISTETIKKKEAVIITEIPYMVDKSVLMTSIAKLVTDKKLKDISGLVDESSKGKIRIVIELKKDTDSKYVINFLALVQGKPKILTLKDVMEEYVRHRKIIITNRSKFELKKAKERLEIVDGLMIALQDIDGVIALIKGSKNKAEAAEGLIQKYKLSLKQAEAILETKLQALTSLEVEKLKAEQTELKLKIQELEKILGDIKEVLKIIKKEVENLKENYGDKRKTTVLKRIGEFSEKDLVQEKEVVVTVTDKGYCKRMDVQTYKEQKRGGKGVIGSNLSTDDYVKQLITCSTHDNLMFFTTRGRVLWLKAHDIPATERYSKGKAIVNLLNLRDERVTNVISVKDFNEDLFMATQKGQVKKIALSHFSKPRASGVQAISFNSNDVRAMGRASYGVTGIKLGKGDEVVSLEVLDTAAILTISENGYGKRTAIEDYRKTARAGKGVINLKVTDKTGKIVTTVAVNDEDTIIITTAKGIVIRTTLNNIRVMGRATQGVRIVKLAEGDKVTDLIRVLDAETDIPQTPEKNPTLE